MSWGSKVKVREERPDPDSSYDRLTVTGSRPSQSA